MKTQAIWLINAGIFVGFAALIGCSLAPSGPAAPPEPVPGIDAPVTVDGVSVQVNEARLRDNFQTHYLMTYAEAPHIFYQVIVSIEGTADPLAWGKQNLKLLYQGQENELVMARWLVVGEDVQYKVGEDFDYRYEFIYNALQDSDFKQYRLGLPDGSDIDLSSIVVVSGYQADTKAEHPGEFSALGGGQDNFASGPYATICGGSRNRAGATHTTIGGGDLNQATASHATVGGGRENSATNFYATTGGGYANTASGRDATIAGGSRNTADSHHATVSGGIRNAATSSDTVIAGGAYNAASDVYAAVGGGTRNQASGYASAIAGGAGNIASGEHAAVGGGLGNQAGGDYASLGGGHGNQASGAYTAVPGGLLNRADGAYSLAAGQRAIVASSHPGVFLFADSSEFEFYSMAANEFAVRATGGARLVSALDEHGEPLAGVNLAPGSGSWSTLSDQASKTNIAPLEEDTLLQALAGLPITTWYYKGQDPTVRHLGPSAQDFRAAFGLGEDARHISSVDADGVALAAAQSLYRRVQKQQAQIEALETRLQALENGAGKGESPAFSMVAGFLGGLISCWMLKEHIHRAREDALR